jgi:hypothetical protein
VCGRGLGLGIVAEIKIACPKAKSHEHPEKRFFHVVLDSNFVNYLRRRVATRVIVCGGGYVGLPYRMV